LIQGSYKHVDTNNDNLKAQIRQDYSDLLAKKTQLEEENASKAKELDGLFAHQEEVKQLCI